MAYENLCMYCFEDLGGESVCPHCGRDNRAAVPQIQMLPGSLVYHDRFLIGRALGQDATGIVYAAFDTKRENKLRLREYLPRDCAERLNDGSVVPMAGLEDQFEKGLKRLRASVEGVEDPKKRHFFFEENGTAYIAQRKNASAGAATRGEDDGDEERGGMKIGWIIGIGAAVVLVAAVVIITLISGALSSADDVVQTPTIGPNDVWAPEETPTPTPYVSPTFAALVDPEQSWMDYTYSGNVEQEFQQQVGSLRTATPKPTVRPDTPNYSMVSNKSSKEDVTKLQERLKKLGWLSNVTGKYDSATTQAVKAFQTYINENVRPAESLTVDGIAGPKTMMWLYGTDQSRPTPAPTPLVTADPRDDLTVDKNSSKNDIRAVQRKLIVLGLMKSGSDDGVYGTTTASAVKQFQQRVNEIEGFQVLGVTGSVDPQTMAYLNHYVEWWQAMQQATAVPTATATVTPNPTAVPTPAPTDIPDKEETGPTVDASSPKEAVQAVQQMLIQIGLMNQGSDDGIYGSGTVAAVAKFQEWYNQQAGKNVLAVTGTADAQTLDYLEYVADNGMLARTPAPTEAPTPVPTDIPDQGEDQLVIDRNSPKEAVKAVQQMLIQVGLLKEGSADGVFGNGTASAVVSFQQFVNATEGNGTLAVTGVCDATTLSYLEQYAEAGMSAAPTQAPAGSVSNLTMSVDGVNPGAEPVAVTGSEITFRWSAQGDVDSYYLYIDDSEGGSLYQYEAIEYTEGKINASELIPGEVYTIRIGALPVGGGEEDIVWSTARFYVPGSEATADPTAAPAAGAVLSINGARVGSGVTEVSGDPISFNWSADGDVKSYSVEVTGDDNSVIFSAEEYRGTSGQIPQSELKHGVVYTFTVGVNPADGGETVWSSAQFRLAGEAPTEKPADVPTPVPVTAPVLNINGSGATGGLVEINTDTIEFSWSADGEVESYAVRIFGDDNSEIFKNASYTGTTGTVKRSELKPGVTYTITVGARPAGGSDESVVWSQARFTVSVPPTEAPTPVPTVAAISEPQINIDGTAYSKDGVAYLTGNTAIFSWMATGEVESYSVYLTNSAGQRLDLGSTTETSRTVTLSDLAPDVYKITVGAKPAGGSETDILWKSMTFGIPSPEPEQTAAPENTQAPAPSWPQSLDRNSAAESIQQVQMKLYELGRLSTEGLQPGVLDAATLQAIADFQQQMNERFEAGLIGIDPANPDAVVDAATLQALQSATVEMFQ